MLAWTSTPAKATIFDFITDLNGSNEVPANASPATGSGIFSYDDVSNDLTYHITFSGLVATETAAHFHVAPPGVAGPVVFPLPLGSPKDGVWAGLSAANETALLTGNI